MRQFSLRRRLCAHVPAILASIASLLVGTAGHADPASSGDATTAPPIRVHSSLHFRLHTDVSHDEACRALERMEKSLARAARYWGVRPRGRIECYLAESVAAWPEDALPHPLARLWIGAIGGATTRQAYHRGATNASDVTIFASTRPGIVEHEVVHAYCCQAFGATGPDWYKEGMAQFLACTLDSEDRVQCPPEVLDAIQTGPQKSIAQIVGEGAFTRHAVRSLDQILANRTDPKRPLRIADWTAEATDEVAGLYKPYCWSWALCHFLANNRNYAGRFRRLGEHYLGDQRATTDVMPANFSDEVAFEFSQFVRHAGDGYSTDICRWEWDKQFRYLDRDDVVSRRVTAARGYQATGLAVRRGECIAYKAHGRWSTMPGAVATDADGADDGSGRLVAAVLHEYQLSEPFELGTRGQFTATGPGHLYVRYRDAWNGLADNTGSITVRFAKAR